jgi:threonine dehydrogenase-like Zn-dependent dehydrogenase
MKAVVFHAPGEIRLEEVEEPKIQQPTDAIVRLTASAICGTDLHFVRGTVPGVQPGTILGHEGVGVIEELGPGVRNFRVGQRVAIASTIACGYCSYCRAGYFSQCDKANPHGKDAGTAFYGGPKETGPFQGLQAERARIPFANVGLVELPDEVTDDQAILLSDIFPTGYFGAHLADIHPGSTVVVFGCGPVGQFAITSCNMRSAGRVLAVDNVESRLEMARTQGAEVINFDRENPVELIKELTGGIGPDRAIDAVGIDAIPPRTGQHEEKFEREQGDYTMQLKQVAPRTGDGGGKPGEAPSQVLKWAVDALAKAGTLSIVGVYPKSAGAFPIGKVMNKNLTIKAGNCNHRRYLPELVSRVRAGEVDPTAILTQVEPLMSVIDAYRAFEARQPGWVKVELKPSAASTQAEAGGKRAVGKSAFASS